MGKLRGKRDTLYGAGYCAAERTSCRYDPDTGKVDIDKVEGRTSKSDRDKINILIDEIREISEEYGGSAPKNVIYGNLADKYNISENKADDMINMLTSKGVIYSPTSDHYKVA